MTVPVFVANLTGVFTWIFYFASGVVGAYLSLGLCIVVCQLVYLTARAPYDTALWCWENRERVSVNFAGGDMHVNFAGVDARKRD